MDRKSFIVLGACLIGLATSFPFQVNFPDTLDDKEPPSESLDVFSRILEKNQASKALIQQGDILVKKGRNAYNCADCLWPKSSDGTVKVPYKLSASYSAQNIALLNSAMQEFESLTCVRFVPWTTEKDFLNILASDGCSSYIGRIGGSQELNLDINGCMRLGKIEHEMNHALGFFHEQNRSDRDDYVTIMTQYISESYFYNFEKLNTNNLGVEYDYGSVMHYPSYAFSNTSGKDTIIPKGNPNIPIGQRDGLSPLDISKINKLYKCDVCSNLFSTINGIVTSANYPSSYPNNANCVWLIRTPSGQVSLQFNAFDIQYSSGCVSDYLKIYDGPSKMSPVLVDRTCGTGLVPLMISSSNQMLIEFVSDGQGTATGFKASYTSVQCGGAFYATGKVFTSPGYPNFYSSNMHCSYLIKAPAGNKITISFSDFSLESSGYCRYDYVKIYDGDNTSSSLLRTYCGPVNNPSVMSTGNAMLVIFHSDQSTESRGFKASYTFGQYTLMS
ncbi:embryonic protein UVS.2-like [Bombina bombina]|uniref:embryonic protein UVS.2-like n=1 Tax=Bombina bombina TaxID=8345 RepID=UPI00235AABF0|nr:embryonic protein UVS.2-like [Bombina bombina]